MLSLFITYFIDFAIALPQGNLPVWSMLQSPAKNNPGSFSLVLPDNLQPQNA
jgi:hypothetical protein